MKKIMSLAILLALAMFLLTGCGCEHEWNKATCILPPTCAKCGETEGEALGHTWVEATCVLAKTCSVCGETEGEPLGHQWTEATCTEAKVCNVCNETEGQALGHTWVAATCTSPKTCSVCGAEEGEMEPHKVEEWTETKAASCTAEGEKSGICTVCGAEIAESVEMLAHEEGDWVITEKATYSAAGKRTKSCKVCGNEIASEEFELTEEEKVADFKKSCAKGNYNDLARNPDSHIFEKVSFRGTVVQVMEDGEDYTLRVKIGSWQNVLYVTYTKQSSSESRILENDVITMYGYTTGTVTYKTVMGASVTIPSMSALYIDFK